MKKLILSCCVLFAGGYILYRLKSDRNRESFSFMSSISPEDNDILMRIKNDICRLNPKFKSLNFRVGNASETINKKNVYLCLKDSTGNYYDYNMLMYVTLHECAHVLSKAIDSDHNNTSQEFMDNFKMLLDKAESIGIYDPNLPKIQNYCPT